MFEFIEVHNKFSFKNLEGKKGSIDFNNPIENGNIHQVTYWGLGADDLEIQPTTIPIPVAETINPSKVAKWILRKLAEKFNSNDAT